MVDTSDGDAGIARQAIILVHGMGEQTPMSTLRGFAEALWKSDHDLHKSPSEADHELYFVPDARTGSRELRRISTRESRERKEATGPRRFRTDFFEFYWADVTGSTTWRDFLLWYQQLVFRSPRRAPVSVRPVYFTLWLVNVYLAALAMAAVLWMFARVGHVSPGELYTAKAVYVVMAAGIALSIAASFFDSAASPRRLARICQIAGAVIAVLYGWVVVGALSYHLIDHCLTWIASEDDPVLAMGLAIACGLVAIVPPLLKGFLIHYFGDVAKYTLNLPGNIEARREIRERGVALLRNLTNTVPKYDRIVIAAHSLGSIIAYDLICLLWADYVATQNKGNDVPEIKPNDNLADALSVLGEAVERPQFSLREYRLAQRAVQHALREMDKGRTRPKTARKLSDAVDRWIISDLVTIGSPLTHAEFLLARDAADFKARVQRREIVTCPPAPAEAPIASMTSVSSTKVRRLSTTAYAPPGKPHVLRLRHDAAFAAVRWTNIHDKPANSWLFLFGDIISGPLRALFGPREGIVGVADVPTRPTWPPTIPLPRRLFTHTLYWALKQEQCPVPESVLAVRKAINLLDEGDVENDVVGKLASP